MRAILIVLLPIILFAQEPTNRFSEDTETAYKQAMKGVSWALSNIPDSKSRVSKDVIHDDRLIASVVLTKEVNGVKIESKGIYKSYEVKVKLYRSNDSLKKEGYL